MAHEQMQQGDRGTDGSAHQAARQVLTALATTYKKLNLYSESHTVYQEALNQLNAQFDDFLVRFGPLGLRIDQERILYDDQSAYEGLPETNDPASILHRDGLLSLTFQPGLAPWEVHTLLTILRDYSVLEEDAEDDIVTSLWKFDLPSIHYEAAELELGPAAEWSLPGSRALAEGEPDLPEDGASERGEPAQHGEATVVLPLAQQPELFQLTEDEQDQLRRMVVAEDQLDGADYVVDVLLCILEQHCLPDDVGDLLGTLLEELRDALRRGRSAYLQGALTKLKHHLQGLKALSHWSAPHVEQFFSDLAGETFLDGLLDLDPPIEQYSPEALKTLKQVLLMLGGNATAALAPLMLKTQSAALQRFLLETIAVMARRDFASLEATIHSSGADLAGRLVFVLGYLRDDASRQTLSRLLQHSAAPVRRQALKAILARDGADPEEIFLLVQDPDEAIRKMVLQRLGRERDARAEMLLLNFLENDQADIRDDDHCLALWRTLGRCGSDRSIPFITRQLFRWPRLGILRPAHQRQRRGALMALEGLNTKRSAYLIQRSKRGLWGNLLRSA